MPQQQFITRQDAENGILMGYGNMRIEDNPAGEWEYKPAW